MGSASPGCLATSRTLAANVFQCSPALASANFDRGLVLAFIASRGSADAARRLDETLQPLARHAIARYPYRWWRPDEAPQPCPELCGLVSMPPRFPPFVPGFDP